MEKPEAVVATFPDHAAAEAAVKKLNLAGFDIKHLSVIGKGYHPLGNGRSTAGAWRICSHVQQATRGRTWRNTRKRAGI